MKKSLLMLMVIIALCISGILHHTVVLQQGHDSQYYEYYVVDGEGNECPGENSVNYNLNIIRPHFNFS